jgi:glycosyltransferase involved in cell wall biosynthesis
MAAGVPVVTTEVGLFPELREAHGVLLWPIAVEATDEENAQAIRQAAENRAEAHR